jgi:hypothetical protein
LTTGELWLRKNVSGSAAVALKPDEGQPLQVDFLSRNFLSKL